MHEPLRKSKSIHSAPMTAATAEKLYAALESKYLGKVWRVMEVCPVAVVKTIDNEDDALETIRRIEASNS